MKTYEQICAELDAKIAVLEDESTPLIELVEAYKEATVLLANAQKMLDNASKSIELIAQNGARQNVELNDARELAGAGALGVAAIAAGQAAALGQGAGVGGTRGQAAGASQPAAMGAAGRQAAGMSQDAGAGGAGRQAAGASQPAAMGGAGRQAAALGQGAGAGGAGGGQGWGEPAARGFPGEYQAELPF